MVLEVRLDRVPAAFEGILVTLMTAAEPLVELQLGAVAQVADASRDQKSTAGAVAGAAS